MSKLSKLKNSPVLFFRDAVRNRVTVRSAANLAAPAPKKPAPAPSSTGLPAWYRPDAGPELAAAVATSVPAFLYVPWIAEHTNDLVMALTTPEQDATQSDPAFRMVALDIFYDLSQNRSKISRFAQDRPDMWRKMILRRLIPLSGRISGMMLTFDWHPVMRILVKCCQELGIRTVLVPHEAMFFDRKLYYRHDKTAASCPITDTVLCWNAEQHDIFVERGFPPERIIIVGSPKLDAVRASRPMLDRAQFHQIMQLDPARKTVLFACQPMDAPQVDPKPARARQLDAIRDLAAICDEQGFQLLVRRSPGGAEMTMSQATALQALSENVAFDGNGIYMLDARETLHHCDLVASINSTMLVEATVLGKPALRLRYFDFDGAFGSLPIPEALDASGTAATLKGLLGGPGTPLTEGDVVTAFRPQTKGGAVEQIRGWLWDLARQDVTDFSHSKTCAIDQEWPPNRIDVAAITSTKTTLNTVQSFFHLMMNISTLHSSRLGLKQLNQLSGVDVFFLWGSDTEGAGAKKQQKIVASALGRPLIYVEDGFLRSADIGLSGEPTLSIILDDTAAYYDARKLNRLQRLFNDDDTLDDAALARARAAIAKIVSLKVSKYNHAPTMNLNIGRSGVPKVLLVDQRFGDQSVSCGLADDASFEKMLKYVLSERPDCDIIVKQHPDAIKGGKQSYLNEELVSRYQKVFPNIYPISFDVNPYSLFDIVHEVFVVTSGMGFEALMAGKQVHCFGAPFYAGRGLTTDHVAAPFRHRVRTIEEVFYYSYITLSRYYDPVRAQVVEVEDIVDHIARVRS